MDTSGIFISADHLKSLSKQDQDVILRILSGQTMPIDQASSGEQETTDVSKTQTGSAFEHPHLARLSEDHVHRLLSGCSRSPNPRKVLEWMAKLPNRYIQMADIARVCGVGVDTAELKNILGGLTHRVRNTIGIKDIYLIDWAKSADVCDENGCFVDKTGEISEVTYQSLRVVLGGS